MDMIERCAKAIYEKRNGAGCKSWSLQPAAHREPYLKDAWAVIATMTKPTPAIKQAAADVVGNYDIAHEAIVRAMNAALNEHEGAEKRQSAVTKQAAINKIIDEDPVNNWWLEEDAFEGWK